MSGNVDGVLAEALESLWLLRQLSRAEYAQGSAEAAGDQRADGSPRLGETKNLGMPGDQSTGSRKGPQKSFPGHIPRDRTVRLNLDLTTGSVDKCFRLDYSTATPP